MRDDIHADVIVIGAGIAGALTATGLARTGVKVVMLESGPRVDRAQAVEKNRMSPARGTPEAAYPDSPWAPRPTVIDLKGYYVQDGPELFSSTYERIVGGTTWHWLGTALRLVPNDFRLHGKYGVGVDWPISYHDLEPWYARAEREIGVSGVDSPDLGAPRSTRYPMPPIPQSYLDRHWATAARKVGLRVVSTPQARNSVPHAGRPACCGNANCIPICPIGAKYDAGVHVAQAERHGVRLVTSAVARHVEVTPHGVTVRFLRPDHSEGVARGRTVVLAANAMETPKLMLLSKSPLHPKGLGNQHDNVGRYLMDHPTQLSWALAPMPVFPYRGPLSTSGIEMLRDGSFRRKRAAFRIEIGNDGWSWPHGDPAVQAAAQAMGPGPLGARGLKTLGRRFERQVRLASLTEPLPDARNRVTLADEKDALGIPRPRINYRTGDYSLAGLAEARRMHDKLFAALRASDVHHWDGPQGAGHVMGTCRMGDDQRTSVVDAHLRVHGHANCFVIGTAVYPTVGTANPTLTLAGLSLRAVDAIKKSLRAG
jgi:choline dehydrogenase-like flavoprotein